MTPHALWVPFDVGDLDAATRFYTGNLGLPVVDEWDRDGERGVVLRAAERAFVELVTPGTGQTSVLAFELPRMSDVDASRSRWTEPGASSPRRFPRGHYGFTARGPAGTNVLVWSEK